MLKLGKFCCSKMWRLDFIGISLFEHSTRLKSPFKLFMLIHFDWGFSVYFELCSFAVLASSSTFCIAITLGSSKIFWTSCGLVAFKYSIFRFVIMNFCITFLLSSVLIEDTILCAKQMSCSNKRILFRNLNGFD